MVKTNRDNAIHHLNQAQRVLQKLQGENNRNNNAVKGQIGGTKSQVDAAQSGIQERLDWLSDRARLQISDVKDNAGKPPSLMEAFKNTNKLTLGAGAVTPFAKDLALWGINSGAAAGAAGRIGGVLGGVASKGLDFAPILAAGYIVLSPTDISKEEFKPVDSIQDAEKLTPDQVGRYGNYMISNLGGGKFLVSDGSGKPKEMTDKKLSELFHKVGGVQLEDGQSGIVVVNNPKKLIN